MASIDTAWSNNLAPPPPPPRRQSAGGEAARYCFCPYCVVVPERARLRSHLRRHYREVHRAMVRDPGLAPRARLAVLRALAFRNNATRRARIRSRRPRGLMAQRLSPNYSFWAAHRWRGTWPQEIDFLGLGVNQELPSPAATQTSSEDSAPAPAPAPANDGAEVQGDHGSFAVSN
uniref:Uncharacterized protein n=1 Tax=Leersia perrieri TaxID=77586 RepID=A0A0D9VK75_9ORYZ